MASEKDVVLIHLEDTPIFFARIEQILPNHKPGWHHVKLLVLQTPLQVITWILRDAYIDGESFTMGGKRMRMEQVVCPEEKHPEKPQKNPSPGKNHNLLEKSETGKVISLADLKKK